MSVNSLSQTTIGSAVPPVDNRIDSAGADKRLRSETSGSDAKSNPQVNFGRVGQSSIENSSEKSFNSQGMSGISQILQGVITLLQSMLPGKTALDPTLNQPPQVGSAPLDHLPANNIGPSSAASGLDKGNAAKNSENVKKDVRDYAPQSLGSQLSVQKDGSDVIKMDHDPERGDVIKVDFRKGHYTEHSTSPRAEIKDNKPLAEGKDYGLKFGMKRTANNDGTFFQLLDHNSEKPSPRAWLATKNGQYELHLKTQPGSDAPSKVIRLGNPGDAAKDVGKWADFKIDFKRGVGDGSISVSKNGHELFHQAGISTMFDTHSSDAYSKFGQYRNEGDHQPAVSYFSGFSVSG